MLGTTATDHCVKRQLDDGLDGNEIVPNMDNLQYVNKKIKCCNCWIKHSFIQQEKKVL